MRFKFMKSKEVKQLYRIIENQWGCKLKLDYGFLKNEKHKIYVINREIDKIDFSRLKINAIGLYIGELKNNFLRLSIEGSQLIGPLAKKNIIEVSKEQLKEWLKGEEINAEGEGFVIIKHGKDYFGCGKAKEGVILNYVPKTRRLNFIS